MIKDSYTSFEEFISDVRSGLEAAQAAANEAKSAAARVTTDTRPVVNTPQSPPISSPAAANQAQTTGTVSQDIRIAKILNLIF